MAGKPAMSLPILQGPAASSPVRSWLRQCEPVSAAIAQVSALADCRPPNACAALRRSVHRRAHGLRPYSSSSREAAMMSIFGSRGDRHTTTSRHAKPQVEGLEQIIALSGVSASAVTVTAISSAIMQQGSTVTVNLGTLGTKVGNVPGASLVINTNRLKIAEQQARFSGTATVEATVEVKGSRHGVPVILQVTKTTATSTPTIAQQGSTVKVNLRTGATLVISVKVLTQAVQQVKASGTATVIHAVQQAEASATATVEANRAAVTNTVTATSTQTITQQGSAVKITL